MFNIVMFAAIWIHNMHVVDVIPIDQGGKLENDSSVETKEYRKHSSDVAKLYDNEHLENYKNDKIYSSSIVDHDRHSDEFRKYVENTITYSTTTSSSINDNKGKENDDHNNSNVESIKFDTITNSSYTVVDRVREPNQHNSKEYDVNNYDAYNEYYYNYKGDYSDVYDEYEDHRSDNVTINISKSLNKQNIEDSNNNTEFSDNNDLNYNGTESNTDNAVEYFTKNPNKQDKSVAQDQHEGDIEYNSEYSEYYDLLKDDYNDDTNEYKDYTVGDVIINTTVSLNKQSEPSENINNEAKFSGDYDLKRNGSKSNTSDTVEYFTKNPNKQDESVAQNQHEGDIKYDGEYSDYFLYKDDYNNGSDEYEDNTDDNVTIHTTVSLNKNMEPTEDGNNETKFSGDYDLKYNGSESNTGNTVEYFTLNPNTQVESVKHNAQEGDKENDTTDRIYSNNFYEDEYGDFSDHSTISSYDDYKDDNGGNVAINPNINLNTQNKHTESSNHGTESRRDYDLNYNGTERGMGSTVEYFTKIPNMQHQSADHGDVDVYEGNKEGNVTINRNISLNRHDFNTEDGNKETNFIGNYDLNYNTNSTSYNYEFSGGVDDLLESSENSESTNSKEFEFNEHNIRHELYEDYTICSDDWNTEIRNDFDESKEDDGSSEKLSVVTNNKESSGDGTNYDYDLEFHGVERSYEEMGSGSGSAAGCGANNPVDFNRENKLTGDSRSGININYDSENGEDFGESSGNMNYDYDLEFSGSGYPNEEFGSGSGSVVMYNRNNIDGFNDENNLMGNNNKYEFSGYGMNIDDDSENENYSGGSSGDDGYYDSDLAFSGSGSGNELSLEVDNTVEFITNDVHIVDLKERKQSVGDSDKVEFRVSGKNNYELYFSELEKYIIESNTNDNNEKK